MSKNVNIAAHLSIVCGRCGSHFLARESLMAELLEIFNGHKCVGAKNEQ